MRLERTEKQMTKTYITIAIVSIIMLIVVIYGFSVIGSPTLARDITSDRQKIADLSYIATSIQSYYSQKQNLPSNLDELKKFSIGLIVIDPDTKQNYEYIAGQDGNYQLCSTFKTDSNKTSSTTTSYIAVILPNNIYNHPKGHYCFELKVVNFNPNPILPKNPAKLVSNPTPEASSTSKPILSLPSNLPTSQGITTATISGLPYFVIVGTFNSMGQDSFIVKTIDQYKTPQTVTVTYDSNLTFTDMNDNPLKPSSYVSGDSITVLANTKIGTNYKASSVKDFSR